MANYIDGLYIGRGRGIGPYVQAQATIDGGQLSDFTVTWSAETTCIGGDANTILAQQILKSGGDIEGVSTISGATYSTQALLDASAQIFAEAQAGYNDGTYFGVGRGIGPYVKVKVTIANGLPVDGKVVWSAETGGIGAVAGPAMMQSLLDRGTLDGDVDVISGATVTSNAFNEAINDIRTQASGATALVKYEAEQEAKAKAKAEKEASAKAASAGAASSAKDKK